MRQKTAKLAGFLCALVLVCVSTGPARAACYPTSVTRNEEGTEIRKIYDLSPEEDPAGIPRSDFEQEGFRYTLVDLLRQELPEHESRRHTEAVSLESKSKDMASVLALLPPEREFVTEDGLSGVLALQLDTVNVEVSGYGNATKELTATRTYPSLTDQDTQYIPKTIQDSGHTLTLQTVDWQTQGDGHFTAVASYTGSAASSYVKGYTVTADYTGTVSRINLNKVRYVAIYEGTSLAAATPEVPLEADGELNRNGSPLVPIMAVAAVAVVGTGVFLAVKRRRGW